jgi:hypothetical protein
MSAIKTKNQNVNKEISSDLIPDIAGIFAILKDKAIQLKKVHDSLGVRGIKTIFDLENPNLTNEDKQILKGKYIKLK